MKVVLFLLSGFLSLGVCGCCERQDEPTYPAGMVVKKTYQPKGTTLQWLYAGKTLIPIYRPKSERWVLTIQEKTSRKEETKELFVSQEAYDRISVGDTYTVQPTDETRTPVESRTSTDSHR